MKKTINYKREGDQISAKKHKFEIGKDQRQEIKESFDLFDTDANGVIDKNELGVCMQVMGFDTKKYERKTLMKDADANGDGVLDYPEFMDMMAVKMNDRDPKEELHKDFKLFDRDNSGKIGFKNLKSVAKELGENMSDCEIKALIKGGDRDGDDQISEQEFARIMGKMNLY